MENNNKDFMKNRPVVAPVNQIQDVYGSQRTTTRTVVTVILIILMAAFIVISILNANWMTLSIFAAVLIALIISLIIGARADRKNAPVEPEDTPGAIFREHKE